MESRRDFPMGMTEKVGTEFVHHYMPNASRITQVGKLLWQPTVTGDTNIIGVSTDYLMRQPQTLQVDASGWGTVSWTGLSISVPADGLMQFLMHSTTGSPGTWKFRLTNANGNQITYEFRNSFMDLGQKTFQFWNPATDANLVLAGGSNQVITQTGDFFDGSLMTGMYMEFNPAVACSFYIDGLYTQTKIKPMICHTVDYSSNNVYTNFVPIWESKGWKAGFRVGGTDYNWNGYLTNLRLAQEKGFDIYNGSMTRQNPITTLEDTYKEMGLSTNRAKSLGFHNPILYSSGGNSLPQSVAHRKEVANAYGIKWCKAPNFYWKANVVGANGLDQPLYTYVTGGTSYQSMQEHIAGLEYIGAFIVYFWHECVNFYTYDVDGNITGLGSEATSRGLVAGDEFTTNSTASGGSVWTEAMQAIAEYLDPKVQAGDIDVVGITELDLIMRGLM